MMPQTFVRRKRKILIDAMEQELDWYHNGELKGYKLHEAFVPAIEILEDLNEEDDETS